MTNPEEPQLNPSGLSFNETLRILNDFLEVVFHHILYVRNVYPPEFFERRRKYDLPVFSSRHPLLSSYISDVVSQSMAEIAQGLVTKLILVIQDAKTSPPNPLEQFVFDLQYLIDPIITFQSEADRDIRPTNSSCTAADAQVHLRGFLARLNSCQSQLIEISKYELTWTTFLELNDTTKEPGAESGFKTDKDRPPQWIPASDPSEDVRLSNFSIKAKDFAQVPKPKQTTTATKKKLIPLKSQPLGMIQLQMFVIEHPEKTTSAISAPAPEIRSSVKGKGRAR